MIIYLLNILLILIYGAVFLFHNQSMRSKKIFSIFVTLQWILLSGLRHISIGPDTYAYKVYRYDDILYKTWGELFGNFINIVFNGAPGKDPGYDLLEKLIQVFSINYQIYLIIIALIFTIPLGIWIHKNSAEPCISFLIYSCLFYSFFSITGIRQTIATALVVLIGYKFIKERRFWPFLVLVLIAFTIHKSAICFFPFYFIAHKKITKKYLVLMFFIIIFMFIFRNQAMVILGNYMGYEDYIGQFQDAGTWNFTAILFILLLVTVWKHKIILNNNLQATQYINALLMAFALLPLTYINPSAMRAVQYYSLFIMLLVPEVIKLFLRRQKNIVYYVSVILLILLFARKNPQYLFFWQGDDII